MKLDADAIWLAVAPVDMRISIDGLSLHVQQALGRAPCDGTAYVFSNRRRTRLKVVCWDGTGVWMCVRRLHSGHFIWPEPGDAAWHMSAEHPIGLNKKKPSSSTKVIAKPETIAAKPVNPNDAACDWENHVGTNYTNTHPRTGKVDPDRIVSADGRRSVRYGKHEMNSRPNRHHYHKEHWHYDATSDVMTYENELIRCPLKK